MTSFTPDSKVPTCLRLEKEYLSGFHQVANTFLKMKKAAAASEPPEKSENNYIHLALFTKLVEGRLGRGGRAGGGMMEAGVCF